MGCDGTTVFLTLWTEEKKIVKPLTAVQAVSVATSLLKEATALLNKIEPPRGYGNALQKPEEETGLHESLHAGSAPKHD